MDEPDTPDQPPPGRPGDERMTTEEWLAAGLAGRQAPVTNDSHAPY